MLNLALSGTLERYPDIRWIFSHAGGSIPSLAWRWTMADHDPVFSKRVPQGILTYLRRLYYDIVVSPSPHALKPVLDLAGPMEETNALALFPRLAAA